MKKILFLLIGLSILASCTNADYEPTSPEVSPVEETLLLATQGFPGYPEMIYDLQGDTVYQCVDAECHILSLKAEGRDWYALLNNSNGTYSVVKNGATALTTDATIFCMKVENGIVFTVQENKADNTLWVYRDSERLYELDRNVNYNTFFVQNGNITFTVNAEKPYTWWNGRTYQFEGLVEGFGYTYEMDKNGLDILILYQDYRSEANKYYWNGAVYDLPDTFIPSACRLVNGHAFIMGRDKTTSGVGSSRFGVPAVFIDGVETVLSDMLGLKAVQVVSQGIDTFILVKYADGGISRSMIYKNLQYLALPNIIVIPEDLRKYYTQYGTAMNLGDLGITDIAMVNNAD